MNNEVPPITSTATIERLRILSLRLSLHNYALLWSPLHDCWVTIKAQHGTTLKHEALQYIEQHPALDSVFNELPVTLTLNYSRKHAGFSWTFRNEDHDEVHTGWTRPTQDSAKALAAANEYADAHKFKIESVEITPEEEVNYLQEGDDYDRPVHL